MSARTTSRFDSFGYRCMTWLAEKFQIAQVTLRVLFSRDDEDSFEVQQPSLPEPKLCDNVPSRCHCNTVCTLPPAAETALMVLQEEVASLKHQVSILFADRNARVTVSVPPPPPPPPPPMVSIPTTPQHASSEKKNLARASSSRCAQEARQKSALLEVLKDLGKVTLKKVEKSPSGTPLKSKSSTCESLSADPNTRLTAALRARYASLHPGDSSDESTTEPWSPASPRSPVHVDLSKKTSSIAKKQQRFHS
ncbi:mitochondrial fission regulator 2-like isoform X2 [Ornithodoros turicata]|uniref:mitochondrial fission regulator 2-like isoform X2 n=1 Tax=Ornithodoros turicata TaxID=34597 RepID=UPI0031398DED